MCLYTTEKELLQTAMEYRSSVKGKVCLEGEREWNKHWSWAR